MNSPHPESGFFTALVDAVMLVGTGIGVWWLVDWAVPPEWCAGGRWDAIFLFALLPLFFVRFAEPPRGRIRWMQSALVAACAALATPAAVMAGRLIGGCTDVQGVVGGLTALPHFAAGLAIGLATVGAWLLLAARLPAAEQEPADAFAGGAGRAFIAVATVFGGFLSLLAWPILVDAAATAILPGYCPSPTAGNTAYPVLLILFYMALRHRGWAAWRPALLAGLGAIAAVTVADVAAGLVVACPLAGEDLAGAQRFLRIVIRAVGFGIAAVLIFRLHIPRQPDAGDENPDKESAR